MIIIDGNAYCLDDGTLMTAPVRVDGTVDPEWIEVTDTTETPQWLVELTKKD
jgi:hypothetical protein